VLTLTCADGTVLTLTLGGPFTCDAEPKLAEACNDLWAPADQGPANPDPDLARANCAAFYLEATITDTRERHAAPFDPEVDY
jgi:hypothetical protein